MVAEVTTYTVEARKDGRWWVLTVPEVPGAVSQVRSLTQADEYAREAVAFVLGVAPESFELAVKPTLPRGLASEVRRAREAVKDAETRQLRAASLSRKAAGALRAAGLTGADTAQVLGVSPQRVSQLVSGQRESA